MREGYIFGNTTSSLEENTSISISFNDAVKIWHEGIPIIELPAVSSEDETAESWSILPPHHDESRKKPRHVAFISELSRKIANPLKPHVFTMSEDYKIIYEKLLMNAPSKRDVIDTLRLMISELFHGVSKSVGKNLRNNASVANEDFWRNAEGFTKRAHGRRPGVVSWDGEASRENSLKMIQAVLDFGVTNVAANANSYFLAILELFYEKYGRDGTPEEYEIVAHSVLSILLIMASNHDDVFHAALSVLQRPEIIEEVDIFESHKKSTRESVFFPRPVLAQDFILHKDHLELRPEIVESIRERVWKLFQRGRIELFEPRTGCPGKALFPVIFKETLRVAKETLFAHPEYFRSLPREVSNQPEFITPENLARYIEKFLPEIGRSKKIIQSNN